LREHISGNYRLSFAILSASVACVLLIACANLCNLLLARAASRRQEWAVRMALGASRSRLLRQMLAESFLLSCAGAASGLFLAQIITNTITHSRIFFIPLLSTAHVDGPALFFTVGTASLMALILGVVPALQLSGITLRNDLKDASRGLSEGAARSSFRAVLIVAEVAVACVLLVGAGLLIQSFVQISKVDLGFQPQLTFACRVRTNRDFKTNTESIVYFDDLSHRIKSLPGVESVAFTRALPLGSREIVNVRPKGASYRSAEAPTAFIQDGDPGFFQTLRVPLISGRYFNLDDTMFDAAGAVSGSIPTVIVNEKLARDLWPNQNAADQSLFVFENANPSSPAIECKVVGVVGNVRQSPLEITPAPQIYVYNAGGILLVRTQQTAPPLAPAIREALRQVDSDVILEDFRPLTQMVDEIISPRRLIMLMSGGFAIVALLLAMIGIYGVIAYSVGRRAHEIGIRLAVGASRANVIGLIVNQGMRLAGLGCLIGLIGALGLTRFAQSLFFGISATDPIAFTVSSVLLLLTALTASGLPALKASRTDIIATLRQD
jgi:predicted permease